MARLRVIPEETSWLRRYCRNKLRIEIPLDVEPDELRRICAEIPTKDWRKLQKAYAQANYSYHRKDLWLGELQTKFKDLSSTWRRLIAMRVVTEEEARLLAEWVAAPFPMWSDSAACSMLRVALAPLLEDAKANQKAGMEKLKQVSDERVDALVEAGQMKVSEDG